MGGTRLATDPVGDRAFGTTAWRSRLTISASDRHCARNLAERGFDFTFAAAIFTGPTVERADARRTYGEARRVAIGRAAVIILTVHEETYVHTLDSAAMRPQ